MLKIVLACVLLVASSQATTVLSSGSTCYDYFSGFGFYTFYSQPQTCTQAVQTCLTDGGQLGVISSSEEAQLFSTIIGRYSRITGASSNAYFFVGITEFHDSRDFLTLDGVPLEEAGNSNRASGQPNNANVIHEKCGSINRIAEFNDISCSNCLAYINELKYPSTTRPE